MTIAFILIKADLGKEKNMLNDLGKIENVEEAHFVYGAYDIIVKLKADSMEKLKETVTWKIRLLKYVKSTTTMLVIESL